MFQERSFSDLPTCQPFPDCSFFYINKPRTKGNGPDIRTRTKGNGLDIRTRIVLGIFLKSLNRPMGGVDDWNEERGKRVVVYHSTHIVLFPPSDHLSLYLHLLFFDSPFSSSVSLALLPLSDHVIPKEVQVKSIL